MAYKLRKNKCPRCHKTSYREYIPGKGWYPVGKATFEVGDFYVNLVCQYCGWRIDTSIQPRNVASTKPRLEREE